MAFTGLSESLAIDLASDCIGVAALVEQIILPQQPARRSMRSSMSPLLPSVLVTEEGIIERAAVTREADGGE